MSHGQQPQMMTKRQREKDDRLREQGVSCCTSDEDDEQDPVPHDKKPKAEVEARGEASSSEAGASSSTAEREMEQIASTAHAAPPGSRSSSVISVSSTDASRPPSAASSSAPSRPLKRKTADEANAAAKAAAREADNARHERARNDARQARERAGLGGQDQNIQLIDGDDDGEAEAEPDDDLAELLEVLDESVELGDRARHPFKKAPFHGISSAAELAALLKADARWFDETASKPISVALREGGKMTSERLLNLISEPEGDSSSGSGGGGRPAQVMRRDPASRHWKLGALDDKNMTLQKLDKLMQESSSDAAGKSKINDQKHSKKYTVAEWDKLPETAPRRAKELDKLLHWPVSDSPLRELKLPEFIDDTNWCRAAPGKSSTFSTKLQLVHDNHHTGWHFDNGGCDTWMKLLQGKVFVATCSLNDAKAHGLEEFDMPMKWSLLRQCGSARLFVMRKGDVLLMPAGTYHYVYTIKRKLVVAGDILNASGWRTRVQSCCTWVEFFGVDKNHETPLVTLFKHGVVNVEQKRAQQWLSDGKPLSPVRHRYVRSVLEWARALQLEGGAKVDKELQSKELQEALQVILDCYDTCSPTPAPSHHGLWEPEPAPLDQLVAMGFPRESAEAALAGSDGNVRMAAGMLAASTSDEAAVEVAATAPPSQPGPSQPGPPSLEAPPSDADAPPPAPAPPAAPAPAPAPAPAQPAPPAAPVVAAALVAPPRPRPSYPCAVGDRVVVCSEKPENAKVNGITVEIEQVLEGKKYMARVVTGRLAERVLKLQHLMLRVLELPLAPAALPDSPE